MKNLQTHKATQSKGKNMEDVKALEQIDRLTSRFTRTCPSQPEYQERLAEEFEIILSLRFTDYFCQIRDILDVTQDIPHMTRGSAGSSLVCYLMGITDVNPIEWDIPVARFLNPKRDDLPDVDIDYPHYRQEEVMNRIFKKWPGKSARISNYVLYQDKSAKREAAKRLGHKGRLPRKFTYESLGIDPVEAKRIERKLKGKKKCISKHCGGILMFTRQLPKSLISQTNQILLDKNEVADLEHLKVDILSNRGLSQLIDIDPQIKLFEYPEIDEATSSLLSRGDVLGVTQGESPAMRRLFRAIRPQSMLDCVFATALIRPVAMQGRRKAAFFSDWTADRVSDVVVCEDDAIVQIAKLIGCDFYEADMYRRAFAKKNEEKVMEFMTRLGDHPRKDEVFRSLQELSGFGLCRAHAVNLGRLIWALAYQKAHNQKGFWSAALKHCHGSYKRWVYKTEAKRAGLTPTTISKSDKFDDPVWQYKKYGWWSDPKFLPGFYTRHLYLDRIEFAGLIANGRVYKAGNKKYVTFVTLGIDNGYYVDLTINKPFPYSDHDVIRGVGRIKHLNNSDYIEVIESEVLPIDKFYS